MVNLNNNRVFHGRESQVHFTDPLDSIPSDTDIWTELVDTQTDGALEDFSAKIMDFTLTDPEASVDLQDTFGGQIMVQETPDLVEVDFTMRFQDLDSYKQMHGSPETFTDAQSTEWTRYDGTKQTGNRDLQGIAFRLVKKGDTQDYIVQYFLNNALYTQMGEVSQEADGAAEVSGTAVCRVKDRIAEQNF